MSLDLPLVWAGLIATGVLFYVLLDGFDLGVGILFPFARGPTERDRMMDAIAPYWDGNETWLVLGGGGLLAAFPLAYAVIMPALYLPVVLMLLALILRGVAFEFRLHGRRRGKAFWTAAFTAGSVTAAAAQGLILGGFIQGVRVDHDAFAGGPFEWLTPYSLLVSAGLVAGYAFLGAGWMILKAEGDLQEDARRWARVAASVVAVLLAGVSLATLFVHPQVAERWGVTPAAIDWGRLLKLAAIPLVGGLGLALAGIGLARRSHGLPFAGAVVVFLSGYLGLAVSFFPYVVPYGITYEDAASERGALGFMLVGAAILLPLILGYTAYVYLVFRGKTSADAGYH